jgi:hypothetical protein
MYIGACRITFALPGNRSLKGKRQVLRKVRDRLRHKFNAAAAEVGDPERLSEAEIGFAVISGNAPHARGMAENILGYLEDMMIAPMREVELEVLCFDDLAEGGSYGDLELWQGSAEAKLDQDEG